MVNTKVCKVFLRAVALGLNEKPYTNCPALSGEEWQSLMDLARSQNMVPLVYDALARTELWEPDEKNPVCARFRREAQLLLIRQVRSCAEFEKDYRSFVDLGVEPIVVKGIICRNTYPNPDLRPSGDEDFLVKPEEFPKLDDYLMWKGFIRDKEMPEGMIPDEMGYVHQFRNLYYEFQTLLFKDSKAFGGYNEVFRDAHEHSIHISADGMEFRTLDHTEHLFFLLTHLLKHFIHGGVGVRQACDVFAFSRKWSGEIDWEKMKSWIVRWKLETFWMNLLDLGQRVLGFSPAEYGMCTFRGIKVDSRDMLCDMLDAGVFGTSTK
ncbi:MAG: nucleotidyltransferase family protein, partial [Lachnospiraceae bacterium]|nr:nucleotidyltransferase family protein [Lachnospiraceae bacterium]